MNKNVIMTSVLALSLLSCGNGMPCEDLYLYPGAYAVFYEEVEGTCGQLGTKKIYINEPTRNLPLDSGCALQSELMNSAECTTDNTISCTSEGSIDDLPAYITVKEDCTYEYEVKEEHKYPTAGTCKISAEVWQKPSMEGEYSNVFSCSGDYTVEFLHFGLMIY